MENIKNWNDNEIKVGEVFHFKNSLEPFICVEYDNNPYGSVFVDIHTNEVYSFEDLNIYGYEFYTKEDDENFFGVEVDGKIEWVDA